MKTTEIIQALKWCAEDKNCTDCPNYTDDADRDCIKELMLAAAEALGGDNTRCCSDCAFAEMESTEEPCCWCDTEYNAFVRCE